jgi:hypothetical protein
MHRPPLARMGPAARRLADDHGPAQRTARRMLVADPRPEGTAAMFGAVAQEVSRSPTEHVLTLRHLHLSPDKARRLSELLASLVDDTEEDDTDQPVHGVLVTVYQQASPHATGAGSPS